ncbi:type II toxin-antitoxin system Phd/YefM family antitoxin [Actinopolyspora erythraea]|uniref:Antitoxin n=1 Tax=Actinopolyspora erythraea TaxID=414996 RepID=A0A099DB05_9ACTN|nr:type II toxin-antitoxin system Phd/YefM family antitoxin [Actinopolyspora erythraea]ASU80116.1 type II toxin-antitoxin system Phd/YefM family antitoxin [Actinopolyspora erythraea]KGI82515.1 hypothetical protein IL38_05200 [Actinopolyspora erythraea]
MSDSISINEDGVAEVSVSDARKHLPAILDAIEEHDAFVYLTRSGRRVAAIMPPDIAENYEAIEDAYWSQRAEHAHAEVRSNTNPTMSWEQALVDLEGKAEA